MIQNARFLLKDVENDKFDKVKIKDKYISKHNIIKFLKNINGNINNDNKDKKYFDKLKSIESDLKYA